MVRCLCVDSRCRVDIPIPASGEDDLVFPISIARSVGRGGANDSLDVKVVQQALNRIDHGQGGPNPKLKPDGIVGPKTEAAITQFQKRQLGFTDGRVDPAKRTIAKINEHAAALPVKAAALPGQTGSVPAFVTIGPEDLKRIYLEVVPQACSCVVTALATLRGEQASIVNGKSSDTDARKLINKLFALDRNNFPARDFLFILHTFEKIRALLFQNLVFNEETFVPAPGRYTWAQVDAMRVVAIAIQNGVNMKGRVLGATAMDGSRVSLPQDKIVLMPVYLFCMPDLQICNLIHETAHFVGAPEGHPDAIDDPPDKDSSPSAIAKLAPTQRPRIAECFATFAFEAHFNRQPINVIL